ncbi:MAG: hypothetical protein ABFS35_06495 [Bacteroidota bacterium]
MKEFEKYQKENLFKVPDGYFEELPGIIRNKIEQNTSKKGLKSKLVVLKPYISIAASFLILYGLWFLFLEKGISNSHLSNNQAEIAVSEMNYFLEDLDQEELIEIFIGIDTSDTHSIAYNKEEIAEILEDIDESLIIEAF